MASIREVSSSLPSPYPSSSSSNLHASAACQSQGQSPGDRCREGECQRLSALMIIFSVCSSSRVSFPTSSWRMRSNISTRTSVSTTPSGMSRSPRTAPGDWVQDGRDDSLFQFSVHCQSCITFPSLFSACEHVGASDSLHFILINSYHRAILEWGHYHFDLSQSTPQFEGSPHRALNFPGHEGGLTALLSSR